MKNIFKLLVIVLLVCIPTLALPPGQPTKPNVSVYLQDWTHTFKPINESCLPGSQTCGLSDSRHPVYKWIISIYHRYSDGSVNKIRDTTYNAGPVYHGISITQEILMTYPNNNSVGWVTATAIDTLNNTTNITTWETNSIPPLGEEFSRGSLSQITTNGFPDYNNLVQLSDNSTAVLSVNGGTAGWTFTYRIYFKVEEWTMDYNANLQLVGTVPSNEYVVLNQNPLNGSGTYAGYSYLDINIDGGSSFLLNLTPTSVRLFYRYGYLAPVFIRQVKIEE